MRYVRKAAVLAAVSVVCLGGVSAVAAAKGPKKGSPAWCRAHPMSKLAACQGGSGSGGTGGSSRTITVAVSPSPLTETGQSEIYAVVEVETSPSLSGDPVTVSSTQLAAVCGGAVLFGSLQPGANYSPDSVTVVLDADGSATVSLYGIDCAPGTSVISADVGVAPYYTALGTLDAVAPVPTPAGVSGSPNNEVETGNMPASGDSDVYAVFYVETDPVYAEQTAEITSPELFSRCGGAIPPVWVSNDGSFATNTAAATIDDDGNAVFAFTGSSCAAGDSTVIADISAGVHSTYTTIFTILAPAPTI